MFEDSVVLPIYMRKGGRICGCTRCQTSTNLNPYEEAVFLNLDKCFRVLSFQVAMSCIKIFQVFVLHETLAQWCEIVDVWKRPHRTKVLPGTQLNKVVCALNRFLP